MGLGGGRWWSGGGGVKGGWKGEGRGLGREHDTRARGAADVLAPGGRAAVVAELCDPASLGPRLQAWARAPGALPHPADAPADAPADDYGGGGGGGGGGFLLAAAVYDEPASPAVPPPLSLRSTPHTPFPARDSARTRRGGVPLMAPKRDSGGGGGGGGGG